jgi:hypothetical protein
MKIVHNKEEEDQLGEGWSSKPVPKEDVARTGSQSGCKTCVQLTMDKADMEVRFTKSWAAKAEEIEALNTRIDTLAAQNEALLAELEGHKGKKAKAA